MKLPGVLVKKGSGVFFTHNMEKERCERERERVGEKEEEADAEAGCGVKCTCLYICVMYANIHGYIFPGLFRFENGAVKKVGYIIHMYVDLPCICNIQVLTPGEYICVRTIPSPTCI